MRLALSGELVPDAVNVQGGQLDEAIKPMLPLAEKIGSIACGLADAAVVRVDVEALGEIADHDVRVLELSALKGVFQMLVHDPVSFVNAPVLAEQRGVEVALTTDRTSEDHRSLLRVTLTQTNGEKVSVAGTVAGRPQHRQGRRGGRLRRRRPRQRAHGLPPLPRPSRHRRRRRAASSARATSTSAACRSAATTRGTR